MQSHVPAFGLVFLHLLFEVEAAALAIVKQAESLQRGIEIQASQLVQIYASGTAELLVELWCSRSAAGWVAMPRVCFQVEDGATDHMKQSPHTCVRDRDRDRDRLR